MEPGDNDDLHDMLARDDDDVELVDVAQWGSRGQDTLAPFTVLQCPVLAINPDNPSWLEMIVNLIANLLGVSVLAAPYAFAHTGVISGAVLLMMTAVVSRETLLMLLRVNSELLGNHTSYPDLGKRAIGPQGLLMVLLAYLFFAVGLLATYVVAFVDISQHVLSVMTGYRVFDEPRALFIALALGICLPGTLSSSSSLKLSVLPSIVCMLGTALMLVLMMQSCLSDISLSSDDEDSIEGISFLTTTPGGLLGAASLFTVQFAIQGGGFELFRADGHEAGSGVEYAPNSVNAEAASRTGFPVAFIVTVIIGASGYLRFGTAVKSNILLSIGAARQQQDDILPAFLWIPACVLYSAVLIILMHSAIIPCRAAVLELFAARRSMGGATSRSARRATYAVLSCAGLLAWVAGDLVTTLWLVGAAGACPLVFILPSLFAVELARRQDGRPIVSPLNLRSLAPFALGLFLLIGSVVQLVMYMVHQPEGHRGHRVTVSLQSIRSHNVSGPPG